MLVTAWRQRNENWAARHLTPAKAELFRRRWNRIAPLGPVRFSLLAATVMALWFELVFLAASLFLGTLGKEARAFGKRFILTEYVGHILPAAFIMSLLVAVTYFYCMREYAKLQPGKPA